MLTTGMLLLWLATFAVLGAFVMPPAGGVSMLTLALILSVAAFGYLLFAMLRSEQF